MTSVLPSGMGAELRAITHRGAIDSRNAPLRATRRMALRHLCFGNDIVNDTA
ncbi:hypothetical protein [Bradyrhizobium iriomotense]|uniref:hypothetical protein n=1 Tax=Bradyrhizobium iriomotense TaxID=441950 RepID=UPI001B8A5CE5|nr:hypothetical protein [Bradyrhizobium iriomotense]MBR0780230.1 hypothetical protein [Bradyrhizobium iriomotense]